MADGLVVIGAGGFGRETLDVVEAAIASGADYDILGVLDAEPRDLDLTRLAARGVRYLGTEAEWLESAPRNVHFVVGIGNPAVRERIAEIMLRAGLRAATIVHPHASISPSVKIGHGVVICGGVQVSTNVTIGDHVHLNPGCIVGHDSALDAFVSVNPGAVVSGAVRVHTRALLGAGSIILQGLAVGADAVVGAGACVTKNVDATTTVVGVPARRYSKAREK